MLKIKFNQQQKKWGVYDNDLLVGLYHTKDAAIADSKYLFIETSQIIIENKEIEVEIINNYNQNS